MRWSFFQLLIAPIYASALSYELNFVGLQDQEALKALFDVSDLVTLQDRPPASINGLRYRIASDIPQFLKVMHAYAYYDATITSDVENDKDGLQVYLFIHPGPQYKLASYEVYHGDCKELALLPRCGSLTPKRLGLKLQEPALSTSIVHAELQLLTELAKCGYPLAAVEKRRVEVDMAEKNVHAAVCVQEGPLSAFGPISIYGLKEVDPSYIQRRIAWKEGQIYNPDSVEMTQKRLLNSDLFSSVLISHAEELDEKGELAMKIRMTEAKHRQISAGAFYATVDGPGISFNWTHRNVRKRGEIVGVEGGFSKRFLAGKISYKKPDFLRFDQSYRALGEITRENIRAYLAFTTRFAQFLERKIDDKLNVSIGLRGEHINVAQSASNGTYFLLGLPLSAKYNRADNLLDPTRGYTLAYQAIPFQSLDHAGQHFMKQAVTTTTYIPVMRSKKLILALRLQAGSIVGARQKKVPLTELFLGGSVDDLRGYRYKTVSPLDENGDPLGGRSCLYASVETRIRISQTVGVVPFADFGTVSLKEVPTINEKWFKSAGIGFRYYTFFGPLRFDIGFPLDKRRGIDPKFRIYAAVGQTY